LREKDEVGMPRITALASAALMVVVGLPSAVAGQQGEKDLSLIWADEFNGTTLDLSKWEYRQLGPRRDAVNVKDAVSLDGKGHLMITTRKVGNAYQTGMIGTQGKFEQAFGYFECRVKFQTQEGHWSAFWLQSPRMGEKAYDPAKDGAEVDIFEYLPKRGDKIQHTLHWGGYGEKHESAKHVHEQPGLRDGWHTVGVDWTEAGYVFYVDGKETWRCDKGISRIPQYIILSLEVGKWEGDISKAVLPDSVLFDYVRVYKTRPSAVAITHLLPAIVDDRYFKDSVGKPVVLIGDYTWGTFSDEGYDYKAMFDTLKAHGLNLARVWVFWGNEKGFESEQTSSGARKGNMVPYLRPGPGLAGDGKPKFDLTKFDPAFFERLRAVCAAARERGLFLQLTLFDAWMIKHPHLWGMHAYHRDNNINGVDGDPKNTGKGTDGERGFCSQGNPGVLEAQKAFIRKVVDTVGEFDTIYFEIANENYYNADWERGLCEFIHEYERGKPKQHLVMPLDLPNHDHGGIKTWDLRSLHANLLKARALKQPLIFDTDGIGNPDDATVRKAAWTAFVSGGHVSYLDDSLQPGVQHKGDERGTRRATLRDQLGHLARLTREVHFSEMQPDEALVAGLGGREPVFAMSSTGEAVVFLPSGGNVALDLIRRDGAFKGRWFDPREGKFGEAIPVKGGGKRDIAAPDGKDWALHLVADGPGEKSRSSLTHRWLFVMRGMDKAENVDRTIALFPRAAKAGYNAVVLSDGNLYSNGSANASYAENLKRVQKATAENGLDLIPCVMAIGYASGIVAADPNLAEGIPVKDAPYLVKGREATFSPDLPVALRGGDFEAAEANRFTGWGMQDNIGTGSFADREVYHGGHQSVRMENISKADPKYGHSRLMQAVKVQPFRQYHLSVWAKTQDFEATDTVRAIVLAPKEPEQHIGDLPIRIQRTQDWTRYEMMFNSLTFSEVRIYIGSWGGKTGRIWWDDAVLEEVGILNPLRRDGCPITVRDDTGTVYEEGKDFEPIRDPKLRAYPGYHPPLTIRLTEKSRIPDGTRLRVSYFHPLLNPGEQPMCCLSDPKVYDVLRDQIVRVNDLLHPKVFFMQHDEIRIANWDESCQRRHMTPGQLLADNVKRCVQIIREVSPQADIWVWSDMFDPMHNAVGDYFSVNGSWAGSWEGLDPKVGIVNWYGQLLGKNAPFFADRGHRQILAGYYDGNEHGEDIVRWLKGVEGVKGVVGAMYTTWRDKYDAMDEWAAKAWGKR
jgi:beta-glucanase (GH16 family)